MDRQRLVHLSDLHLYVTPDGLPRPESDRATTAAVMAQIGEWAVVAAANISPTFRAKVERSFDGLGIHSATALRAMHSTLEGLGADDPQMVILQTGDVSTFGGFSDGRDIHFPEWQYWRNLVPGLYPRTRLLDLFGNHDVWPATFPPLAPHRIDRVVQALRDGYFPHRMPVCEELRVGKWSLELYLVNSVVAEARHNTFANGELRCDHHDLTAPPAYPCGTEDPLDEIAALARERARGADARRIRALVMHHPPHYFVTPEAGLTSEGKLMDADRVAGWLAERRGEGIPFHVVVAGHRHAVDPPAEGGSGPFDQPPLRPGTLQLVCGSPTQLAEGGPRPSFSVYDVAAAEDEITITRTLYVHRQRADTVFVAKAPTTYRLP